MTSTVIKLPSGAEVIWRDPKKITYGERKRLMQARARAIKEESEEAIYITGESIIALLVESWTLKDDQGHDMKLPRTDIKVLEQLGVEDMEVLADRANEDAADVFGTRLAKTKENLADANSPLDSSSDSKDSSKESPDTKI